ncbi:MAG: SDR family oxidoreductase [bacterium]|nr:SDR family oxidoreductase [bacterium]
MIKIALTGSTGLIGSRIIELLEKDFEFIPLLQTQVDITNKDQITNAINEIDFDYFLHLAAYTNVDATEQNKDLVQKINVEGTRNVFETVQKKNKQFIHISTDFVFDGSKPPYLENSTPQPVSFYAQTKYDAEQIVKDKAMIIRLSYPYRAKYDLKKDFVKSIVSLLKEQKTIQMVTDSLMTPTFIDDIAFAFKYLVLHFDKKIYHIVGSDSISPFNSGKLIAQKFHLDESLVQPITFKTYFQNKAKRPQYSDIKTKNNIFYKMKTFEQGLDEILKQLQS